MRIAIRVAALSLGLVALAALPLASTACGGGSSKDESPPEWVEVVTSKVSGKEPVKLNLGTHQLGTKARLAWKLTGADDPPVTLTFRLINADYGTGFGYSTTPQTMGFKTETDNAMTIAPLKPSNFTIYFSQRFAPGEGPGYDAEITVYTLM